MSFETFTFKPGHQPDETKPVEFDLKPLDMGTFFRLQQSYNRNGEPVWEDCVAIFNRNVVGWRGLDRDCTPKSKIEILADEGHPNLFMWLGQIVGELYTRALLKGTERKNS